MGYCLRESVSGTLKNFIPCICVVVYMYIRHYDEPWKMTCPLVTWNSCKPAEWNLNDSSLWYTINKNHVFYRSPVSQLVHSLGELCRPCDQLDHHVEKTYHSENEWYVSD